MRLGELLRQKGLITAAQLDTALHEQSRFGGRLGTNLLQLGYVEMDPLALTLSDQRALPPVLREHVASVDKKILGLFPAKIVLSHKVVPIGYTTTKPNRVVVACIDPTTLPLEELAFAAGRRIEAWIAPEALLQECLERYFGVPPVPSRYVSLKLPARDARPAAPVKPVRAASPAAPPVSAAPKVPPEKSPASPAKRVAPRASRGLSPPPPPPASLRTLEMPESLPPSRRVSSPRLELEMPPAPPPEVPAAPPPEILPAPPPEVPAATPPEPRILEATHTVDDDLPAEEDWDIPDEPPETFADRPLTAPPEALRPFIDRAEASQLLEMATSKDQIGRALDDWLRSTFGCGLLLIVKGDMALGWRGFFPDAEDLIEGVAMPLGKPSMLSLAYESRAPFRGAPPAEGARLHERLWKLLRCAAPAEVLVCPVVLGKRVVNLLYTHMEDGSRIPDKSAEEAAALAGEAAAAYARLIGKDRGKRA